MFTLIHMKSSESLPPPEVLVVIFSVFISVL